MMKELIVRRTGPDSAPRFTLNAAAETTQIAVRDSGTGTVEVIFTGTFYSDEAYKEQGGAERERQYLGHYRETGKPVPTS